MDVTTTTVAPTRTTEAPSPSTETCATRSPHALAGSGPTPPSGLSSGPTVTQTLVHGATKDEAAFVASIVDILSADLPMYVIREKYRDETRDAATAALLHSIQRGYGMFSFRDVVTDDVHTYDVPEDLQDDLTMVNAFVEHVMAISDRSLIRLVDRAPTSVDRESLLVHIRQVVLRDLVSAVAERGKIEDDSFCTVTFPWGSASFSSDYDHFDDPFPHPLSYGRTRLVRALLAMQPAGMLTGEVKASSAGEP